jgi:lipoate-protein ligase A
MQHDHDLLANHHPGDTTVLRLYRWIPPSVSLGYNQKIADFDRETIAARGYDLVQRPTGGRAILHAEELTYAVVGTSPGELFGSTLHETYMTINRALLTFIQKLGLAADISAGESRVAQRRSNGVFLQHGSILTGPAHADLADCLGAAPARRSNREELLSATTDLGRLLNCKVDEESYQPWEDLLVEAFQKSLGCDTEP